MKVTSDGRQAPDGELRAEIDRRHKLRQALKITAEVQDSPYTSRFSAETLGQIFRAMTLHVKEPGTMAWLDAQLQPGDRFLDIGANIGIYTISAAHRVGDTGRVYAAEPHKMTIPPLLENINLNGFADRVQVISVPLTDRAGPGSFNYRATTPGSSGSQFGGNHVPGMPAFTPVLQEITMATTVDDLVTNGVIDAPDVVKVDVDGIELQVLRGMARTLTSRRRPRSVQVELNRGEQDTIITFMTDHNYRLDHHHATMEGERKLANGLTLDDHPHNAVFMAK